MEAFRAELAAAVAARFPENRNIVHGEGPMSPRIMLIGEAPGAQEAKLGHPFVGKAGKNLDAYLEILGIDRSDIYISNTVKFRPSRRSAAGNLINRAPTREEISFFLPFLKREIALVKPACIVTLGNTPLKALLGNQMQIGDVHGAFLNTDSWTVFAMYHPASIIYNPALQEPYLEDLKKLAAWLSQNN